MIENETGLVTEVDATPIIWNFLLGLNRNDLIAELIQNDLDQNATCTVISFERDRLVCEGNGRPVDREGWLRLRKMQGAGDSVPAKDGKIGIKNHGLKTAFAIGDEIRLLSDGRSIIQTLYADGRDNSPQPGASPEPQIDSQAPVNGCRIVIRYRDHQIEATAGEAIVLRAIRTEEMDTLFKDACANIPEQFIGIVSPDVVPKYEIVLRHWHLGEVRFTLSCNRRPKVTKRIEIFRRRCAVSGSAQSLSTTLREEAARRWLPLKGQLRQRVADFYRSRNRFFVEVSWPINSRGKPKVGAGRFRYPIGYPEGSPHTLTGHGTYFNAPIVSDTERHGPARNESTNEKLRDACETLMVDALVHHLIPRWGAEGLNPLVPNQKANNKDKAVRPLLADLVRRGAVPTLRWREATNRALKKRTASSGLLRVSSKQGSREPSSYRFVIPAPTWKADVVHAPLSIICPRSERQLDPQVHSEIVHLLTDGETEGWCEDFITFDENDALSRAKGEDDQYFFKCEDLEGEFANPLIARSYLDVIKDSLEKGKCDNEMEGKWQEALLLPDTHAKPMPFHVIHAGTLLPSDVPGLHLPPILHQKLTSHALFRRRKWHRPKYTMTKFLESGSLQGADEPTRKAFWEWLCRNEHSIAPRVRSTLANISIWPDVHGNLCGILDLCSPRSKHIGVILGQSVRQPHESVRRLKMVTFGKKGRTSIRRIPSQEEINNWMNERVEPFLLGDMPKENIIVALKHFETDLTILLKNADIARLLRKTETVLPALAQDGSVRRRIELVMPSRDNERLSLLPRLVLMDSPRAATLNKPFPVLSQPTVEMLLSTFEEDPANFDTLQARLCKFIALKPSDDQWLTLTTIPILPVQDQPCAPRDLAFKGSKGDHWGEWKIQIPSTGLSQDDQQRYRTIGVTSALPNPVTSRKFFEWLSKQDTKILERHVSCVLRQILCFHGPEYWAETFTNVSFIPVKNHKGLQLISLSRARGRFPVYLPDAAELDKMVITKDPNVMLAIVQVKDVMHPISEPLKRLGVRSLREEIDEPEYVTGLDNIEQSPSILFDKFEGIHSQNFRNTFRKRLNNLGVKSDLLRQDWHARLSRIKKLQIADRVMAHYRFRRKLYTIEVDAGFDHRSNTFLIKKGCATSSRVVYETIAKQLIFNTSAQPIHHMALERALELKIHQQSFGPPSSEALFFDDAEDAPHEDDETTNDALELVEAIRGHSPFTPDPERNIPDPSPISIPSKSTLPRSDRKKINGGSPIDVDNHKPRVEEQHIETLKREHYASHCQMCLCRHSPEKLAPVGSYIEWEEVRRSVVEAHHVDPKSAGGARHAGNLLLLCKLHHDNYGRRLTRTAVTKAFRGERKDKMLRFGNSKDASEEVKGQSVEIMIPDTDEIIEVFFTNDHAKFWCESFAANQDG